MSVFTEFISIRPLPKEKKWITTKELIFYINDTCEGEYIEVPCWFVFDWCSIPICIFWSKIEANTIACCLIHDYMWVTLKKKYSFSESNLIFLNALKANWVSRIKRIRYYLWVTLFWWIIYYNLISKIRNKLWI